MKKLLLFAGLLAVAGCSKELDQAGGTDQSELKLAGKTTAVVVTSQDATKATQVLREVGLGVWVEETTTSAAEGYVAENRQFQSDGAGGITASDVPVTLTVGREYAVYAYAPFISGLQESATTAVEIGHGTDALWAKEEGILAGAGQTTVDLEFKHLGAQIGFQLEALDEATTEVEVTGFYAGGTFDLKTGVVSVTGTADQSVSHVEGERYNFVVPTGQQMTLAVQVTDNADGGKVYNGEIIKTFVPGTAYLYTIKVNKGEEDPDVVVEITGDLTDWEEVAGGDFPIE